MDFTQFYLVLFGNIDKDMMVEFDPDLVDRDEFIATGQGMRGLHERTCRIVHPGRQRHFIKTVYIGIHLILEEVVAALRSMGATGWDVFPVTIRGGAAEPKFYGLVVPGTCGPERTDQASAACRAFRSRDGTASPVFFGRYFHPSKWDGSDIFRFENQASTIVHRRVLDEFRRRGIRIYAADQLDHAENMNRYVEHLEETEPGKWSP